MILASLAVGIFNLIVRGFIISVFWRWFILSQFTNLPALSFIGAIGLSLFIEVAAPTHSLSNQEIEESAERSAQRGLMSGYYHFVSLVCVLILGWFVHLFY